MNIANGTVPAAERQLCRLCLGQDGQLMAIFGVHEAAVTHAETLSARIRNCLQLEVTQIDSLPKWICKLCLEKIDDFTNFRERCKHNEQKLLLGDGDSHMKDDHIANDAADQEQTDYDDEDEEEMEMIVIDPTRDYESSGDESLPAEAYVEKNGLANTQPEQHPAAEEDDQQDGSEAEDGEEEEEEDDEEDLKCDTIPAEARNGLPHTGSDGGGRMSNATTTNTTITTTTTLQKTIVYTCKYCDVAFAAASACQLHEMQDHDLLAPYGCLYCHYKTSIRTCLITHIRDQHSITRPYICVQCNKGFLRRSDLKKHTFVHTGVRPYACDQCGKSFSRNTNLKKHMLTHSGLKPHACESCDRSFSSKADLLRHMTVHNEQLRQHPCVRCGTVYTQKDKLYEHERYCMGRHPNSTVGFGGISFADLKQEAPFVDNLTAPIAPPPPQMCTPAEEAIKIEPPVIEPPPSYAPAASQPMIPQTPASSKIYDCSKCPKRFLSKISLRAHQSTHSPEESRKYECPHCKKHLSGKREFEHHLQTHMSMKPFACATCGKRFSAKDKLHRHERVHQQDRHFSCPNCAAKFVRKDALEAHLQIHCNPNAVPPPLIGTAG
uniref:Protein krueppel n=1 Tax=Anopheles dirus TaxID=7168 RepID=A0A182NEM8_9DIPT